MSPLDYRRVSVKVPVETAFDLQDLRTISGGNRGFNQFVAWVLGDWCRREKKRRKAWERRRGRKLGDPE